VRICIAGKAIVQTRLIASVLIKADCLETPVENEEKAKKAELKRLC